MLRLLLDSIALSDAARCLRVPGRYVSRGTQSAAIARLWCP
jgi:hypothetical protein